MFLLIRFIIRGRYDPRVRHLHARPLVERALDGVGRVYPAERVEDVLGQVFGVHTVNGVTDILARRHDQAERDKHHHSDRVMQPEHGRVNVHVRDLDEVLEAAEYVQHGVWLSGCLAVSAGGSQSVLSAASRSVQAAAVTVNRLRLSSPSPRIPPPAAADADRHFVDRHAHTTSTQTHRHARTHAREPTVPM